MKYKSFNPQAVGRDSGVPFSFSNFLEWKFSGQKIKNSTNVKFRSSALTSDP